MPENQSRYHDSIGKWLIDNKGCQQNNYSRGYIKELKLVDNDIIDVFGLRYNFHDENTSFDYFTFHGYAVKIALDEQSASYKAHNIIDNYLLYIPDGPPELKGGLHNIKFYIAIPGNTVSAALTEICKHEGIGILKIQYLSATDSISVEEELKPSEISLHHISNTDQQSVGTFITNLNNYKVFNLIIKDIEVLFDDCLRPKLERYRQEMLLNITLDYLTSRDAKEAQIYILQKIKDDNSNIFFKGSESQTRISIYNELKNMAVMYMDQKRNNFNIETLHGKIIRIKSKSEIEIFSNSTNGRYQGEIEQLYEEEIRPLII